MMFLRYLLAALIGANAYAYWERTQPTNPIEIPKIEIDWSYAQLEWSKNTGDLPQWKIKPQVEKTKPKPEKPKKTHRSNEPLDIRTIC